MQLNEIPESFWLGWITGWSSIAIMFHLSELIVRIIKLFIPEEGKNEISKRR